MSRRKSALSTIAAIALCWGSLAAPADDEIKCWENRDGVRECGNVVPPEYAQQERTEISDTGVTTGRTERAKSPEELAQAREEAAAKKEAERLAREQAVADRDLLNAYSTEEDIILTRDSKVADAESYIRITENHVDKLNKNLHDIITQAAAMEQRGEQPGEKVAKDIESVRKQIREQEAFIAEKRADQAAIRERYDADLERYREMKARIAARTVTQDTTTPASP